MLIKSEGNYRERLKDMLDKPIDTTKFRVFDKMLTELGPHMHSIEVDKCIDFMYTMEQSEYDINPSINDCKSQLKLILGEERYEHVLNEWNKYNQKTLSVFGVLKYKNKRDTSDKTLYDGLDDTDNPEDWEKVYV